MSAPGHKTLLILVTEDWAFCTHRIPTAQAAKEAGYTVVVVAHEDLHRKKIEQLGFTFHPWKLKRRSLNPLQEFRTLLNLIRIYKLYRPTVAYHVTLKPIIYGTIAARLSKSLVVINLFTGLGSFFFSQKLKYKAIRALLLPLLRFFHTHPHTWLSVQNSDNMKTLEDYGLVPDARTVLIPGSGIDTDTFIHMAEPSKPLKAVVLSRMLWDKGIKETVEAARIIKAKGRDIQIILVGDPDPENPSSIAEHQLKSWHKEGLIEWRKRTDNIIGVWKQAHVALLASYHEGMPRSLLEGASCGRPMISTDAPGCRSLVKDGHNGLLVPIHDPQAIADALITLDDNDELRRQLGKNARKDMEDIYSAKSISLQIQSLLKTATSQLPASVRREYGLD